MHNDQSLFQYFSIDSSPLPYSSYTAIHPSYILNQAIYVNDAIKAIVALYQKKFGKGMPLITVAYV